MDYWLRALLALVLSCGLVRAQTTEPFPNYVAALPTATNANSGDLLYLLQGGFSKHVTVSTLLNNAGAVTSVSAGDGSLTINPTSGSVVATLNVGHSNTWTALQNFLSNSIPLSALPQGSLGVVGYNSSSTGNASAISGTANQTLVVNGAGTAVGFGALNLGSSAAVTGGSADQAYMGTGSGPAFVSVNNCSTALTYSTSSHSWGCAGSSFTPGILYATQQSNVSGSNQSTTGTISLSSSALALSSALDFVNGQGIRVNHAGSATGLGAPTGGSVTPTGTTGSTHYSYTIVAIDAHGGYGAPETVTTTTGNATLSNSNYNAVAWTAASGSPVGYAVYGNTAGSASFMIIVKGSPFNDTGITAGEGATSPPDYLPTSAPGSGAADWLVTTISSGGGTTSLTLGATAGTAVTGGFVRHDDTVALQAAINTATTNAEPLFLNQLATGSAAYWISSALTDTAGSSPLQLYSTSSYASALASFSEYGIYGGSPPVNGPFIYLSSATQDGIDLTKGGGYLHDLAITSNNASAFQTAGCAISTNSSNQGNRYEGLMLLYAFDGLCENGRLWTARRIYGNARDVVFYLITTLDSSITESVIVPYSIPGSSGAIGIYATGDPGGVRISNNKINGFYNTGIEMNATVSDGDFFVIGNSIEGCLQSCVLLEHTGSIFFSNIMIVGNEIDGSADGIQFSDSSNGLNGVTITGNSVYGTTAISMGDVGYFVISANFIDATTGISISASASACGIGFNVFSASTQITDSSGSCTYAAVTNSKPTYP